jgi:hypothetical protein
MTVTRVTVVFGKEFSPCLSVSRPNFFPARHIPRNPDTPEVLKDVFRGSRTFFAGKKAHTPVTGEKSDFESPVPR